MRKRFRYALMTMSVILCLATAVFGQRTTGDIEGKVTDTNGAVVPGISITVTGITVGFSRIIQSDSQGEFRVQQIPAGTYKIATSPISGFAATIDGRCHRDDREASQSPTSNWAVASATESVVVTSDQLGREHRRFRQQDPDEHHVQG